jgi:hypothetical protein
LDEARELTRVPALGLGWLLVIGGIVSMVPFGTRTVGPPCSGEFCLPIGVVQRTGIFGHLIGPVSLTAGVVAVLVGAALVTRVVLMRSDSNAEH